ncbi:hypothetical protein [Chitinophaga sp. Cy-1792]|uniref:hypothetical protein n=1 Tax=Chitinophaga sp. Cy-1792 TaxID=2608339 RepID=UPI001420ACE2|nr:hypothetical protein [Chitinophaga sp. Cy-1792]NIG55929.1 hypothetical protein [Chitinophaga sp. Cy-1792]
MDNEKKCLRKPIVFGVLLTGLVLVLTGFTNAGNAKKEKYILRTILTASAVPEGYVFCSPTPDEEDNCFFYLNGIKYLKKSKQYCDRLGNISHVDVFHSEGRESYTPAMLRADAQLLKSSGWILKGNVLQVTADSIVYPVKEKLPEALRQGKKFYLLRKRKRSDELTVYEIW